MDTRSLAHAARFRIPALGVVLVAAGWCCDAAEAQATHTCQVDGRVMYQSSPCPAVARVATSAPTPPAPAASAGRKKKTLADLLHERDAEDRGRPRSPEFQRDGADVLPSRMGAV